MHDQPLHLGTVGEFGQDPLLKRLGDAEPQDARRAGTLPEEIAGLIDDVAALIGTLHEGPRVTIAAVHGAVAGGGLGIALACDVVLAAPDTTFAIAYGRIGTSPDLGVSAFLVRDLGYRRALELCLLCERLTAAQALELGIINRVVPRELLDDAARARRAGGGRAAGPRTRPPSASCARPPTRRWPATSPRSCAASRSSAAAPTGPRASPRSGPGGNRSSGPEDAAARSRRPR